MGSNEEGLPQAHMADWEGVDPELKEVGLC